MGVSESANRLRVIIDSAIEKHSMKRSEYDSIISIVHEDGFVDSQEKALLAQLQDLIDDKTIRLIPD
jgi:hypothetical protein